MAEGTRLRDINDQIRTLEEKIQAISTECHNAIDEKLQQFGTDYNHKLGALGHQLEEIQLGNQQRHDQLMKMLSNQGNSPEKEPMPQIQIREGRGGPTEYPGCSTRVPYTDKKGKGVLPNPYVGNENFTMQPAPRQHQYIPYPKLDYPIFGGDEPREWLSKSEQFFKLYQIPEEQWVEVATMHFTGKAHRWKEGYMVDKPELEWTEFVEALCRRFDGSSMKKLVREFNKLEQTNSVEVYQERFEDLRMRMLHLNPTLSEEHFIESYISGLKD